MTDSPLSYCPNQQLTLKLNKGRRGRRKELFQPVRKLRHPQSKVGSTDGKQRLRSYPAGRHLVPHRRHLGLKRRKMGRCRVLAAVGVLLDAEVLVHIPAGHRLITVHQGRLCEEKPPCLCPR